jgi:hypothetical protein
MYRRDGARATELRTMLWNEKSLEPVLTSFKFGIASRS